MQRKQAAKRFVLVSALALFACVPSYAPPTADQPHALVKFRRRYAAAFGPTLTETFSINGQTAFGSESIGWNARIPDTDGILVHPGPASIEAEASFWHLSRDPGYPIGFCGGWRAPMSCYSTSRTVPVTDALCRRALDLVFRAGRVYLLELDFVDDSACRLVCYQQQALSDGRIKMLPCTR